ncbi:unnamed protein product [Thlaspi arvense]|uniref:Protein kinase domain-containing protein n=1 Tax=Thlaspi arvense TaxID=13288 RepID=A0AAU9SWB0_THLAR|nr:unnamed protein product [Thlaspi arvense]
MANSIFFFSFVLALPFVCSVQFNISQFRTDSSEIAYQGDARANGAVELTNIDYTCRAGWATYGKKVPLWDPETGKPSDFSTRFSFRIDTRNYGYSNYGHGFAFFLAPARIQLPPNSAGGYLGLFNETNVKSSSFPLVHVEFDTYGNSEWDPLDVRSHVGINNNSLVSSNYTSWNASSHSQDVGRVLVFYDSARRNLSVSWSYDLTSDPRESSSLSYIIDLSKVLPSEVTVGFSATSGGVTEGNRLLSWEYSSSLELIDMKKRQKDRKGMIIGILVSGFVLLAFFIVSLVVFLKRKQRKKKAEETAHLTSINEDLERGAGPRKFAYRDLASAANNFSGDRKLGEGGFGAVYKGYLNGLDMMVAIKKFAGGSKQGRREFITEVKIISSLRHRNLVQLIGWCHEKEEFLMVYEFMPNGSLDAHLFGEVITSIDEKLGTDGFDKKQAECMMVVGLWCAHPDRNSRPSIKQAIQVLNLEAPWPHLPTKMPVATYHVSSSSTTTSASSGGATVTFSSAQLGR